MKKPLLVAIVAILSFNNAQAQLPNGSTGPDFTVDDINGNSISLYTDFLDQGIPVIMDISATWCGPCWGFHQTHAMKDIYMNYGDGGSGEIGVLFVEGDGSTGLAELQGSGNTTGDWVTGTPYPILDNAGIASSYQITYYPTMYGICPDRTVYEIGALSASGLMQALITNCSSVTGFDGVIDNAAIDGGEVKICAGQDVTPSATVHNYGTNALTSATIELFELGNSIAIDVNNWTGNLSAGGSATVQFNTLTGLVNSANYEISVSNPNGNTDNYPALNDANFGIELTGNTLENSITFSITTDNYPEETSWEIKDGSGSLLANGGPYTGQAGSTFTEIVTLANDDCYEVTINDSYGDGLLGSAGYSVTDAANLIIFQEVGPSFGFQVIEPFSKSGSTTGAEEFNYEGINIYPNPAKEILNIKGVYTSVNIYDVFGKLVLTNESQKPIDVSSLSNGVYFTNIKTKNSVIIKKITITN